MSFVSSSFRPRHFLRSLRFLSSKAENEYSCKNILALTSELNIVDPSTHKKWPVFRILDEDGTVRTGAQDPNLSQEVATKMYRYMGRIRAMDTIFYNAQRQGRISFYMTASGEEAIHVGTAVALDDKDTIFAQYREVGILLWRGFTLDNIADQCFSNKDDNGKGRQMPVHYGSKKHYYQTISSPLATQIPQASGAAYALKQKAIMEQGNVHAFELENIVVCFFGEGAASEGDFHAGLNFAATRQAPVLFICRNNGYAISTPLNDQFRGDGIVSRAIGYGMDAIRVDGNDPLAMFSATRAARNLIIEKSRPVLLEAMTYRIGHHSTSDDSTRYRGAEEIRLWQENDDPMMRFRKYLEAKGWWNENMENTMRDEERNNVLQALERGEKKEKPPLSGLFDDVYDSKPPHLIEQENSLLEHIAKYPSHYQNQGHH